MWEGPLLSCSAAQLLSCVFHDLEDGASGQLSCSAAQQFSSSAVQQLRLRPRLRLSKRLHGSAAAAQQLSSASRVV